MPYNAIATISKRKKIKHCKSATEAKATLAAWIADGAENAKVINTEGVVLSDDRLDMIAGLEAQAAQMKASRAA